MSSEYEKIYLNQSKLPGKMRIADSGLGWKAQSVPGSTSKSVPFLLPSEELSSCYWSRGSRGYELRIDTKNKGVVVLDGFDERDSTGLKHELSKNFSIQLETKEHSLRGWNWGKIQMARNELIFNIANKPAYEIPYNEISNTNLSGRNEVSVELDLIKPDSNIERAGDELVEIKFYVPGNVETADDIDVKKEEADKEKTDENTDENTDEKKDKGRVMTKAELFVDELKSKADITQVVGEVIVSLAEILFITPRGRYDIDMYDTFLRLRGKTYDYKLQYTQIQRIFSLPKLDGMHHLLVLQVNPPLRQGQTKYSFLTLQFDEQEEIEVELNINDEEYEEKYKGKINRMYSSTTYLVLSNLLKGFTERRVVLPGSYKSKDELPGISCSLKANEGHLYALEKCALFLTKPTVLIPYSDVRSITFSRVGQGSAQRTFDMEISLTDNITHNFGNIDRAEQPLLESFFKSKNLKVRNDEKIAQQMLANAMVDSDGDVDLGSADDSDSPDEDFNGGSDSGSDVDEEYDSDAQSAGEDDEPASKKQKKDD